MTEYVLGFLFHAGRRRVVLLKKARPEWQVGQLNGVGGRVEGEESPLRAMWREFLEETGISVSSWSHFLTMRVEGDHPATIYCFVAETVLPTGFEVSKSDEPCYGVLVESLMTSGALVGSELGSDTLDHVLPKALYNVPWLVAMAYTALDHRLVTYEVVER